MSDLKVGELAYVRMQVPDLAKSAAFLTDFGLVYAGEAEGHRYFRASDSQPYCYEVVEGPARFLGCGFELADRDSLDRVAQSNGLSVQKIEGPGGGEFVRLREPNGHAVDLLHGRMPSAEITVPRQPINSGLQPLARKGELYRAPRGQVLPVKRLAHVVLGTPRVDETIAWFRDVLGLLISDEIVEGPQEEAIGAFMRRDAGDEFVDHHIVFIGHAPISGLHHLSFEVQDIDALLAEHARLKEQGEYEHIWGIGRHLLGSQIFDYWRDPFGYVHEHWSDSDRVDVSLATTRWQAAEGLVSQWGDQAPSAVRNGTRP